MVLKELNLGKKVKCTCRSCNGTGVVESAVHNNGFICYACNGRGYYNLLLNDHIKLVKDEETDAIYKTRNNMIIGNVKLFDKLNTREGIENVMYAVGGYLSPKYLFEHGANSVNIIKYKEFLEGKLPLPVLQYTCPRLISQNYGDGKFNNNCGTSYQSCKKFGTQECWDKFYGNAKTDEEKQAVLKRL